MAATDEHNPLQPQHLEALNQALRLAPKAASVIAKLRASGVDVEQAQKELDTARDLAIALKRNFFPEAP